MAVRSLKWNQVLAWRLSQHCLSGRLSRKDFVQAATRTGGLQAQVMSAAELGLAARVDGLSHRDVETALWRDRTLIKTWAMRAALHLISADDLPLYAAARSLYDTRNWEYYFSYYGLPATLLETYLETAPQVLSGEPLTREQFAVAVAERTGSKQLQELILDKSWGTPLKPLAWRGDLCFGPSNGRNVTFVNPAKWLGEWEAVEPYPALQEVARRYLRAYGPGTAESFARWWELRIVPAKKLFKSLEDELEPVDVEGWQAFALRSTVESMLESASAGAVNLLPLFDAYVMGIGREFAIEPLVPAAYKDQVYRIAGWISAVVLVGGRIAGVWEYQNRRSQTAVTVRMFSPPKPSVKRGIQAEADRLGVFLKKDIALEVERA